MLSSANVAQDGRVLIASSSNKTPKRVQMRATQAWTNSSYQINQSNKVVHLKWGVNRSLILPRSSCFKTKNAIYSPPLQMCGQWPCTYPRRKYPPKKNTRCRRVPQNTGRPLQQQLLSKEKPTTGASSLVTFASQHTLEITVYFLHPEHLHTEASRENAVSPQRQLNEPPAPRLFGSTPLPHPCASQSKSGVCSCLPCVRHSLILPLELVKFHSVLFTQYRNVILFLKIISL